MPYIKQDKRKKLEILLRMMKKLDIKADGDLNYILYTYCLRYTNRSYNDLKNYIAELTECAEEIRRRVLGLYENEKIRLNGDIYQEKNPKHVTIPMYMRFEKTSH